MLLERAIATLTTIFGLIATHPAFSRDLNSLLPTFFQSVLNLAREKGLLSAVLRALHILIPGHATTFRPTLTRTQTLTLSIIEGAYSKEIKALAAKVYVDLHHSAQKGGTSEHWRVCVLGVIAEVHGILDHMFEVLEEGESGIGDWRADSDRSKLPVPKSLGLRSLDGHYAVCMMSEIERMDSLVVVLHEFLTYVLQISC